MSLEGGRPTATAGSGRTGCKTRRHGRVSGEPIRRYEHDHPGSLIHVDVKKARQRARRRRLAVRGPGLGQAEPQGDRAPGRQPRPDLLLPLIGTAFARTVLDDHSGSSMRRSTRASPRDRPRRGPPVLRADLHRPLARGHHNRADLPDHGRDQVVDELVMSFTHDIAMDHLLPGVPPTSRRVRLAVCVVAGLRDGKLSHEHIYWDQASLLVQVGLLDPAGLPVVGAEQAESCSPSAPCPPIHCLARTGPAQPDTHTAIVRRPAPYPPNMRTGLPRLGMVRESTSAAIWAGSGLGHAAGRIPLLAMPLTVCPRDTGRDGLCRAYSSRCHDKTHVPSAVRYSHHL